MLWGFLCLLNPGNGPRSLPRQILFHLKFPKVYEKTRAFEMESNQLGSSQPSVVSWCSGDCYSSSLRIEFSSEEVDDSSSLRAEFSSEEVEDSSSAVADSEFWFVTYSLKTSKELENSLCLSLLAVLFALPG